MVDIAGRIALERLASGNAVANNVMTWNGNRWVAAAPAAAASGLAIVSATEPASPATGQLWLDLSVTYLSNVDWLRYNTYTPPTAAGSRSITFATSVVLSPGIDYWYVLQNNAANANAQGTTDANDTFTNISVTAGMFYSNSGGGFGSSSSVLFPIFGTTASAGTAPQLGYSAAPSNYWGPSSIAQKFRVTSAVTVTGLTQYWGGNAGIAGNWGIARSINGSTHPLRVWDGTAWQVAGSLPN